MNINFRIFKRMIAIMAMTAVIATINIPIQAKTKGYVFILKGTSVGMHDKAKKFKKKAGKAKVTKVKKSCAYNGKDRTYKYRDFILYTYSNSDQGTEYVNGITFLTNKVSTKEGIKIGSSLEKVFQKYGKVKDNFGVYTYKKGKCKLQIEVIDNVVSNIRYITSK